MSLTNLSYERVKKKYLKFLKSQEVLSEPFRNKTTQLNKFFLPISKKIFEIFNKNRTTKIVGLSEVENWKINNIKYFKNYFKRSL